MIGSHKGIRKLASMLIWGLAYIGLGGLLVQIAPIIVVTSESVDCKIVLPSPFAPAKGSYVLLKHPNHDKPLVKKILAIEGEWTPALPLNSTLRPLPPQKIPAGFVFVAGTHPQSFDSRYESFGLIKNEDIKYSVFTLY